MRTLGGSLFLWLAAVAPLAAIEVSTGFLIGASYDPRAFYVRSGPDAEWRKTNSSPEFRKTAHGKLVGIALDNGATLDEAIGPGISMVTIALQDATSSAFDDQGALRPDSLRALHEKLSAADRAGVVVELILFDPARDEEFFSPDSILDAARNLTDWLIDEGHRNVLLNFAADWTAPGWDFGNWIPLHFEQLAETVRTRFQDKRAGYTAPIALSVPVRLREDAPLIGAADLLLLSGEAVSLDVRKIERPAVVSDTGHCGQMVTRLAGCKVESPEQASAVSPLLFSKPPAIR
jgi:hypothetical protein